MEDIRVLAFDLDGTLTQHKSRLERRNREVLEKLAKHYKLLMVGAGQAGRIFEQLDHFPIDIIGNYGMQYAVYDPTVKGIKIIRNDSVPCDRQSVESRALMLREKYGFTEYKGANVEYHPSGCLTFPILGTEADQADKLAFDPDRKKRRAIYGDVAKTFGEYNTFVGGASSFDMAPKPYDKYNALDRYCGENHIAHRNVLYAGDDYGPGGNDAIIYNSDFPFVRVDDYRKLGEYLREALEV